MRRAIGQSGRSRCSGSTPLRLAQRRGAEGTPARASASAALRRAQVRLPSARLVARGDEIVCQVGDAKDEAAQRFYEKFGIALLADEQHRLVLPIATAPRAMK
jgi:hypothetical protein